jgi:hypothetical protein
MAYRNDLRYFCKDTGKLWSQCAAGHRKRAIQQPGACQNAGRLR